MKVLGNRITLHSPSRGMSMELGSATTVIVATIYGLPVSTTMCITGATVVRPALSSLCHRVADASSAGCWPLHWPSQLGQLALHRLDLVRAPSCFHPSAS
jgi:hypothetical protein